MLDPREYETKCCGTCMYNEYCYSDSPFSRCANKDSEMYLLETEYSDYCIDWEVKE